MCEAQLRFPVSRSNHERSTDPNPLGVSLNRMLSSASETDSLDELKPEVLLITSGSGLLVLISLMVLQETGFICSMKHVQIQ